VLHRSSYIMMYESRVVTQSVAYPLMGQLLTLDSCPGHYRAGY